MIRLGLGLRVSLSRNCMDSLNLAPEILNRLDRHYFLLGKESLLTVSKTS